MPICQCLRWSSRQWEKPLSCWKPLCMLQTSPILVSHELKDLKVGELVEWTACCCLYLSLNLAGFRLVENSLQPPPWHSWVSIWSMSFVIHDVPCHNHVNVLLNLVKAQRENRMSYGWGPKPWCSTGRKGLFGVSSRWSRCCLRTFCNVIALWHFDM